MPRVPKWVGDAMESVLASKYLTVRVTEVEYLVSQMKKVCFSGDFRHLHFAIGYAVAFRVNENDFRNYTPARFDPEIGICEVIFHIHGRGPGSDFAQGLKPGDQLKMIIPRGKSLYQPDKKLHFFFGDETSLGLFSLLAAQVTRSHQNYSGILEMDEANAAAVKKLGIKVPVVFTSPAAEAKFTLAWLLQVQTASPELVKYQVFYLVGKASSVQVVKKTLQRLGVDPKNIKAQAYWAEGKTGL